MENQGSWLIKLVLYFINYQIWNVIVLLLKVVTWCGILVQQTCAGQYRGRRLLGPYLGFTLARWLGLHRRRPSHGRRASCWASGQLGRGGGGQGHCLVLVAALDRGSGAQC